ncbi:hypothetical protein [Marinicella sp. W31]|uniref:hypothetical protein n=1 Tax=Marinicella sp. W31 TaxID=3023713 RepID=UPI0037579FFC
MYKEDHIFVSDLGMNVLKGKSLLNEPEAALSILHAIQKNSDKKILMAKLSSDPTIQKLGGIQNCMEQLLKSGLITTQTNNKDFELTINSDKETKAISILKQQLVNLIEKTNHPEVWNFFLNVESVNKKNDLIWILNEIIKQLDPQTDDAIKKQYQNLFLQALEL